VLVLVQNQDLGGAGKRNIVMIIFVLIQKYIGSLKMKMEMMYGINILMQ